MSGEQNHIELTDAHTGAWLVRTRSGSVYRFDLDTRTVERVGGEPRRPVAPADTAQPLRGIIELKVGRPGRWWMRNLSGGYVDPDQIWQSSSVVVSIEAAAAEDPSAQEARDEDDPDVR